MLQLQKRRTLCQGFFSKLGFRLVIGCISTFLHSIITYSGGLAMKKEKVQISVYSILCLVLIILIMCIILGFNTCPKKYKYETYVVYPGDTLWSIAASTNPEGDIREIIYMIRQKNDINPIIYPGQELLIPVLEK
jgi:hypothetical protein